MVPVRWTPVGSFFDGGRQINFDDQERRNIEAR
jgi:hypothetical protein